MGRCSAPCASRSPRTRRRSSPGTASIRRCPWKPPASSSRPELREEIDMQRSNVTAKVDMWTERLFVDGYCVVPDLLPKTVATLDEELAEDFGRTPFCRGGFYGERTKRF